MHPTALHHKSEYDQDRTNPINICNKYTAAYDNRNMLTLAMVVFHGDFLKPHACLKIQDIHANALR